MYNYVQNGPRELVTKDLNTHYVDYVEFYIRMGYGNDLQCRGINTRSQHVLLQYSNDGGISWHLIKELQAVDYDTPRLVVTNRASVSFVQMFRTRSIKNHHVFLSSLLVPYLLANFLHHNFLFFCLDR